MKVLLVVNPVGGGGRGPAAAATVRSVLSRAGHAVECVRTDRRGAATEQAATAQLSRADALVAVGGDGTVHELVQGLMRRDAGQRPALGLVPAGSGNALAHDLELTDVREAAGRIAAGRTRPLDLLRATWDGGERHAFNVVGWGMAADVAARAERWRRLGGGRYTLASVLELLRGRSFAGCIEADGERLAGPFLLAVAANTQHTGRGLRLAPEACLDDGQMRLVTVPAGVGRARLLRLFAQLRSGVRPGPPLLEVRAARRVTFAPSVPSPLNLDGEVLGRAPATVVVVPSALRLLA